MRIGYDTLVENPLKPSSAINYIKSVLRALVQVGAEHEYFVFVSVKNRKFFNIQEPNVHLVNCLISNENIPMRILIQQFWYPILARRNRLDVIHALNQIPLFAPCATVVKTAGLHHHLVPREYLKYVPGQGLAPPLRLLYRRMIWDASARRATLVMANSEATKRDIVRLMGVSPERVRVVFEAVDDNFGTVPYQSARAAIESDFGLKRNYILYVSNLWYYKNPDGAIRAFARQWAIYKDNLDLVIVGPDDYNRVPELRHMAQNYGISSRVHFLGKVSRASLVNLYAAARIMLYPSFAETYGKPVVEAMRSGVPVIAAKATCLPEIVGEAGLLVDPADDDAMAEALHRATMDEELRRILIEKGLRRGRQFSWGATALGTLAMLAEAIKLHGNRH